MTRLSEEVKKLTMEELLNIGMDPLTRVLRFETPNGEKMEREVVFRRLTFKEISNLSEIPTEETSRYTRNVVHTASLMPKFENTDEVDKAPHGFIQFYGEVILKESGKNPFLG